MANFKAKSGAVFDSDDREVLSWFRQIEALTREFSGNPKKSSFEIAPHTVFSMCPPLLSRIAFVFMRRLAAIVPKDEAVALIPADLTSVAVSAAVMMRVELLLNGEPFTGPIHLVFDTELVDNVRFNEDRFSPHDDAKVPYHYVLVTQGINDGERESEAISELIRNDFPTDDLRVIALFDLQTSNRGVLRLKNEGTLVDCLYRVRDVEEAMIHFGFWSNE